MNLRLKFALLFASLVTVILIVSGIVTLYLFEDNRSSDFYLRLRSQAYFSYYSHFNAKEKFNSLPEEIRTNLPGALPEMQIIIVDSLYKTVYNFPEGKTTAYNYSVFNTIKSKGEYQFNVDDAEAVGIYMHDGMPSSFVIVSAYDKYGKRKEVFLRYSLLFVLILGVVLSGVLSLYYLKILAKPFNQINSQINNLTANNLQERIDVPKNYDVLESFAENFNLMLNRLEKSFEIQKTFVHHASHELRTPLAVMLAQTESALGRDLTAEEAKKVLASLREDQQEMIELTNSLLLLSQYEKTSMLGEWPFIRIDELIYDNVAMVKRMYPDMNVSLEYENLPENEEDLSIRGNESLVRSAVRNLVRNAYYYSTDKQLNIIIDAQVHSITIHFDNRGKQLSQDEQDRLFLPFFRGQNAQTKKGFGLGLSIVQRIISIHKGRIEYKALPPDINRFSLIFEKTA
jgi:signal transduction histidine kinase